MHINKLDDKISIEVAPSNQHFFRKFEICCQWGLHLEIANIGSVRAQIASKLTEYGRIILLTIPSQGIYGGQWTGSILVEISKMLPKICYHEVVSFRTSEILHPNKPIMTLAGNFPKPPNNNPQIRAFPVRNNARNSEIRRESDMMTRDVMNSFRTLISILNIRKLFEFRQVIPFNIVVFDFEICFWNHAIGTILEIFWS